MSNSTDIVLTAEEEDVLGEILNIGAGKAAKVLSELMNNANVELSLPSIQICTAKDLEARYKHLGAYTIISIAFNGLFIGSASLLFSGKSSDNFSKALAGDLVAEDEISSMREGILKEIGNIVISGVLGQISSVIKTELVYDLPTYKDDLGEFVAQHSHYPSDDDIVITANISFHIHETDSEGYLFIIFTKDTYQTFLGAAKKFFGVE